MPYRPHTDKEKKQLMEQLNEAKARRGQLAQYILQLEEDLNLGVWFMSDEDYVSMIAHVNEIVEYDRQLEEARRLLDEMEKA